MFFVRAAFWIFLILLLLPTNEKEKSDFYIAAGRTLSDLGGFCTRNPDVCDKTVSIYEMVARKVRNTVQLIENAIRDENAEAPPARDPYERGYDSRERRGALDDGRIAPAGGAHDTLLPEDRSPDWRGPGAV
jgi:hypothetical protein